MATWLITGANRGIGLELARQGAAAGHNAGIMGPKRQSVLDMDFDGFVRTLAAHTLGPPGVTQAFLPNLDVARGAKVAALSLTTSGEFRNHDGKPLPW
ncbi:MAG TPA: hypothetical protein VMU56_06195 [Beijerinckiaceae bacterium]|nr:hypothetical protein [Beijerinckiaceae bacterium]